MYTSILAKSLAIGLFLAAAGSAVAQTVRGSNGHFYRLVSAPNITWTNAKAAAENTLRCGQPGHLVTITSQAEHNFLVSAFGPSSLLTKWIGALQTPANAVNTGWSWVTGEPFTFTQWAAGEPNNNYYSAFGFENAGVFWTAGRWNDAPAGYSLYSGGGYVIEWEVDATVIIDGRDTGLPNHVVDTNTLCTISDLIADCASTATNHGEFVRCVAQVTNLLREAGIITGEEKGIIQSTSAQATIP